MVFVVSIFILGLSGLYIKSRADGIDQDPAYRKVAVSIYKNYNQTRPLERFYTYVLKGTSIQTDNEIKPTEYKFIFIDKSVLKISPSRETTPQQVKSADMTLILNGGELVRVAKEDRSYYGKLVPNNQCDATLGSNCVIPNVNGLNFICKNIVDFSHCDNSTLYAYWTMIK